MSFPANKTTSSTRKLRVLREFAPQYCTCLKPGPNFVGRIFTLAREAVQVVL